MLVKLKTFWSDPFVQSTVRDVVGAVIVTASVLVATALVRAGMESVVDMINTQTNKG